MVLYVSVDRYIGKKELIFLSPVGTLPHREYDCTIYLLPIVLLQDHRDMKFRTDNLPGYEEKYFLAFGDGEDDLMVDVLLGMPDYLVGLYKG